MDSDNFSTMTIWHNAYGTYELCLYFARILLRIECVFANCDFFD